MNDKHYLEMIERLVARYYECIKNGKDLDYKMQWNKELGHEFLSTINVQIGLWRAEYEKKS